jgi:hypothetical protein
MNFCQHIVFKVITVMITLTTGTAEAREQNPGLVLNSFNAAISNQKVALYWITDVEKDFSHFVIERSTNGVDFMDAALVFANGNSTTQQGYFFADAVNITSKKVYYYRLRMVQTGGKFTYSAARTIKTGEGASNIQLQAQPNPVMNELRITIPEAWQQKTVSYDVYNGTGQLVKHLVVVAAAHTELVNMQSLGAGMYMVKASQGADTAVQWIMKK